MKRLAGRAASRISIELVYSLHLPGHEEPVNSIFPPLDASDRRRTHRLSSASGPLRLRKARTENLPRRFGGYLLTSELSQDALGHVFRAMNLHGNGEFVRLRILNAPELSPEAVLQAIRADADVALLLSGPGIAPCSGMGSIDGCPYVAWTELHGWSLDLLIAGFRSLGERLPVEHALLIVDRIAAALEFAHRSRAEGKPIAHGLLCPGFICVGTDGDIRLTGFGLASGVLPSLGAPRFSREIGPYLAPEQQRGTTPQAQSDIYSLGMIFLELLTGRETRLGAPEPRLRVQDTTPSELGRFLRVSLAAPPLRFPSMTDLRRHLGRVLASQDYAPSSLRLSQFLKERLGPQSAHQRGSGESASSTPSRDASASDGPSRRPTLAHLGGDRPVDSLLEEEEVDSVLRDFWNRAES